MVENILNKGYILAQISAHREQLKAMGAEKLGLFGSYARNQQTADSDIDFIIEFQKGKKTYNNFIEIAYFLEDIFQNEVDLLTLQSLTPLFLNVIQADITYVTLTD